MAFRLVFIIKINSHASIEDKISNCLLYKNFPIIEKRTTDVQKDKYVPLPLINELELLVVSTLGLNSPLKQFSPDRDGCNQIEQKPVFKLQTKHGLLYPVLLNDISGIIVGCVMHLQDSVSKNFQDFSNGFGIAFEVLSDIGLFYLKQKQSKQRDESAILETRRYLSVVCPFGKPRCMHSGFAHLIMNPSAESLESGNQGTQSLLKLQANPSIVSSNKILNLFIKETLSSIQHQGQTGSVSEFIVEGVLNVNTNLQEEVSMALSTATLSAMEPASLRASICQSANRIHHCLFHSSCHYTDYSISNASSQPAGRESSQSQGVTSLNLRFVPTSQSFNLLFYRAQCEDQPIRGVYQMQSISDDRLSINFQLQLSERFLQREFKLFEVLFPFPNRPSLASVGQIKVTQGKVDIPQNNRHVMMWSIGSSTRLPVVSLKGEVKLFSKASKHPLKDSFCTHHNAYAQVHFTMNDFNISGLSTDPRTLIYSSDAPVKLTLERQFVSTNFKIWNTLGDCPAEHLDVNTPPDIPQL